MPALPPFPAAASGLPRGRGISQKIPTPKPQRRNQQGRKETAAFFTDESRGCEANDRRLKRRAQSAERTTGEWNPETGPHAAPRSHRPCPDHFHGDMCLGGVRNDGHGIKRRRCIVGSCQWAAPIMKHFRNQRLRLFQIGVPIHHS